ncbi:MAG: hypothetical protein WCD18_09125 [Thermosynechococcaceae cyanobacterium]
MLLTIVKVQRKGPLCPNGTGLLEWKQFCPQYYGPTVYRIPVTYPTR